MNQNHDNLPPAFDYAATHGMAVTKEWCRGWDDALAALAAQPSRGAVAPTAWLNRRVITGPDNNFAGYGEWEPGLKRLAYGYDWSGALPLYTHPAPQSEALAPEAAKKVDLERAYHACTTAAETPPSLVGFDRFIDGVRWAESRYGIITAHPAADAEVAPTGFVRLSKQSDHGKPYRAFEHAKAQTRAELAPVIASLIVRDVCELEPADYTDPNAICVYRDDLATILQEHLAAHPVAGEPAQPVLWRARRINRFTGTWCEWAECPPDMAETVRRESVADEWEIQALYAAPPAPAAEVREPLTDEAMWANASEWAADGKSDPAVWNADVHLVTEFACSMYCEGFRAAERAHGIPAAPAASKGEAA